MAAREEQQQRLGEVVDAVYQMFGQRDLARLHERGDAGIVETYISYLRKKIDAFDPPLIHTVRGVGYRLRLPAAK